MNPSLLLGIVIGMGSVLFCFGVFLALPARRMTRSGTTFNERSLKQLTERNAIGHEQLAALWKIASVLTAVTEINRKMAAVIAPQDTGRITMMVRRGTPDHDAYIKARFPGGCCKSDTFEFAGHRWKYLHSSFDDLGEFDLLWRPAELDQPET
jgi:hypothetical protein